MRKNVVSIGLVALTLAFAGCSKDSVEGEARGFGGKMTVEVIGNKNEIKDIKIISHKETDLVLNRAFPILKERIIEAQSPIVDSVSGATYTSYGVKKAVNDALKKVGHDFGKITIKTEGPEQPVAYLEDVETSIVIVGGGPAGLAAAISAREAGVQDVVLIEKLDILSGNGKYDRNFFGIVNSEAQRRDGDTATAQTLFEDMSKSNKMDSIERIKSWANGASLVDSWLRTMGITLDGRLGANGHMYKDDAYAGDHIQTNMELKVKELGVDVRTGTAGLDLIMEDGKVVGVKAQNKNNFYDIKADAVIMATGGFVANEELVLEHNPEVEGFNNSNQIGATGDFIPVFEKNDFKVENLDKLSIFSHILTSTRALTGEGYGLVLVNMEGKRFMSEQTYGYDRSKKVVDQTEGVAYYIYDEDYRSNSYRLTYQSEKGLHQKADSLEELAEKLGLPVDAFVADIEEYNKNSVDGKDSFGKLGRALTSEGPYYGVEIEPGIHMTKGGVVANENSEVLYENGEVVEGLYAAGEVTSSNVAYSGSVVFGRIAGESAAEFLETK